MEMAIWAVAQVRKWGGVLEHPFRSRLWNECGLPAPGAFDGYHGFTIALPQFWFGHKAQKATYFYICGIAPTDLPEVPLKLGEPTFVVQSRKRSSHRPHIPKAEREATPLACAQWLVELARKARGDRQKGEYKAK